MNDGMTRRGMFRRMAGLAAAALVAPIAAKAQGSKVPSGRFLLGRGIKVNTPGTGLSFGTDGNTLCFEPVTGTLSVGSAIVNAQEPLEQPGSETS